MFDFPERLQPFLKYAFAEIDRAKKEAQKTMDVIDMGVGDPVLPTDQYILDALRDGLYLNEAFRYPTYNGEQFFREAAGEYFRNRFGVTPDSNSEIQALIGSKEGIAHFPFAVLDPGDKAAYTEPGYPVYRSAISFAGGEAIPIPLKKGNDFLPDIEQIPNGIKLLYINYPNNPTTATCSRDWLKTLVEDAHKRGYIIANDAAYVDIYEENPPSSILEIDGAKDVAIEFHSLSKPFAMTGWRIAFAVGNARLIEALGIVKKQIDSSQFKPVQFAGAKALLNPVLIEGTRDVYKRRKSLFRKALLDAGLFVHPSDATFYLWAETGGNSVEFAANLLRDKGIVCLPGAFTGPSGEGFIRFSMTLPDERVKEAAKRMEH